MRLTRLSRLSRGLARPSGPTLASIQRLFLPTDTAALFDPTASALYAAAAGTTAAVTGGPVGLRLDVARNFALGSEIISNGGFDSTTGWLTSIAGWSISNGALRATAATSNYYRGPIVSEASANRYYEYTVVVSELSSGTFKVGFDGSPSLAYQPTISGPGTYTYRVKANGLATVYLYFRVLSGPLTAVIDRVSVREVLGNHAFQGTTALCPIARRTPQTNRLWLEAPDADDALNMTFASAPGTMYVGRGTAEGVEWSTETWGTTVNTVRQGRFNSWLIARSRDWTANERALVESYYKPPVRALIAQPTANPDIGDAFAGGYYTGAAWDSVAYSRSSLTIGTGTQTLFLSDLSPANNRARTPDDPNLPLYAGQSIRLAPRSNTGQVFMHGTVVSRSGGMLTVSIASVAGSGTFDQWVIAARWKVILAPKSGGESTANMMYKTANTAAPAECSTLTNGRAATAAMIAANTAAGSVIYPAADFVRGVNAAVLSGYTDWELPARDWLELAWCNLKPLVNDNYLAARPKSNTYILDANTDDILNEPRGLNRHSVPPGAGYTAADPQQTPLAAFRAGGAQAMATAVYFWSSSEYSAAYAWIQNYTTSYPGAQGYNNKTTNNRVRAVRREIL